MQNEPSSIKHHVAVLGVLLFAACSGERPRPAAAQPGPAQSGGQIVALPERAASANPIQTVTVERAPMSHDIELVGSVSAAADHLAVVGPLVEGRIARLQAAVGTEVRRGDVLAELESAAIGEAQSAYLAALAHARAAGANVRRESDLAARRISAEREREVAVAQADAQQAEVAAARDRLLTIGFSGADIKQLEMRKLRAGRVPMRAPISGTIIERHVTAGQAVERAKDAFTIANLDYLWVMLSVYEKDLRYVRVGQRALLRADTLSDGPIEARVGHVEAKVHPDTRTARVRVEIDNRKRQLRLGQLVTARLVAAPPDRPDVLPLIVPKAAIVRIEGENVAFVQDASRWRRQVVEVGARIGDNVEVLAGLREREVIATDGAFLLKSEALR